MKHTIPALPEFCNELLARQVSVLTPLPYTPPNPINTIMFLTNMDINNVKNLSSDPSIRDYIRLSCESDVLEL